jgi:hypothetical protein
MIESACDKPLIGMQGHQFVGSSEEVQTDPGSQQCLPCKAQQYIIDSNNPRIACQECPIGAKCNGSSLNGLVEGSTWEPDWDSGSYLLRKCPSGYSFHNTSTSVSTFSSVYQECRFCTPSYYCVGGTAEASPCPSNTYSYAGSTSSTACITVSFVALAMSLPMSKSDFNVQRQNQFKSSVAASVGTSVDHIVIASIEDLSRRSATNPSIKVVTNIAADNATAAETLLNTLSTQALISDLSAAGFPSVIVQSVQILQSSKVGDEKKLIIAVTCSIAAAAVVLIAVGFIWRAKTAPASRRLLNGKFGQEANQMDLPYELRNKYEAIQVVGCGSYGVVLDAWQLSSGKRTVRRAVKLVHARTRKFTEQELRRLDREVGIEKKLNRFTECDAAYFCLVAHL